MKKTIAMMLILVLALSLAGAAVAQTQKTSKPFRLPRVLSRVQATVVPTEEPTVEPTEEPTVAPTEEPTVEPTAEPTVEPTEEPTVEPTAEPTEEPTVEPTAEPTAEPTVEPTEEPTAEPTEEPTAEPTAEPTVEPTAEPTVEPTAEPLNIEAVVSIDNDNSALIVRKAPDANAEKVAKLHKGDRVTILAYEGDWARILFNDFLEGYVFAAYLTTEPVEEPTVAPTAEPSVAPTAEPTVAPTAEPTVAPTVEPTVAPTAEPTVEPAAPSYDFERNADGSLKLDEKGNPVAIVPEGMEIPVTYERDAEGNLILDENGNPIPKDTIPADAEYFDTIEDALDPNRTIDLYATWGEGELTDGTEATMIAVLNGYDNVEYALQWQTSEDNVNWTNVPGATESRCTVVVTQDNYLDYWRVMVTVTDVR